MKELEPLINQIVELLTGSKELVISQATDFIKQFIIYSYIDTFGWLLFSTICLGVVVKSSFYLRKNWDKTNEALCFFGTAGIIGGGIFSVLEILSNICDLLMLYFAPKAYIVTHLAACLKGQ